MTIVIINGMSIVYVLMYTIDVLSCVVSLMYGLRYGLRVTAWVWYVLQNL
nr:MAG TPA: hypothetical protein [Caudoviricetes sp.]